MLVRIIVGLIAVLIALSVFGAVLRALRWMLWVGLGVALVHPSIAAAMRSARIIRPSRRPGTCW